MSLVQIKSKESMMEFYRPFFKVAILILIFLGTLQRFEVAKFKFGFNALNSIVMCSEKKNIQLFTKNYYIYKKYVNNVVVRKNYYIFFLDNLLFYWTSSRALPKEERPQRSSSYRQLPCRLKHQSDNKTEDVCDKRNEEAGEQRRV